MSYDGTMYSSLGNRGKPDSQKVSVSGTTVIYSKIISMVGYSINQESKTTLDISSGEELSINCMFLLEDNLVRYIKA